MAQSKLDEVVSLAKRRGFVFPAGEIYGGTRSAWDYGPLGVALKDNIKREWWRSMVVTRPDVVGVDTSIILPPEVWVASGHVSVFNDPLVECLNCHKRNRADKLEESYAEKHGDKMPENGMKDIVCPNCGKPMVVKFGRYGKFIACSGYPECKTVQKIVNDTGAKCPKCGGKIIEKKSKRGRVFYGCDNYPKCDFVSWDAPSDKTCPVCGKVLLKKKDKAQTLYCVTPGCTYTFNKDDAGEKDGE